MMHGGVVESIATETEPLYGRLVFDSSAMAMTDGLHDGEEVLILRHRN